MSVIEQPFVLQRRSPNLYWLESTAGTEVDRKSPICGQNIDGRVSVLVRDLVQMDEPHLVVRIHGYSNTREVVAASLEEMRRWLNLPRPSVHENPVFVVYRWPAVTALKLPIGLSRSWNIYLLLLPLLGLGVIGSVWAFHLIPLLTGLLLGALLMMPSAVLVLLRLSEYYRDQYRAQNHGVLDLVEFVRRLDAAYFAACNKEPTLKRCKLSLVGHSMGGFVATNTVRILSDVFDTGSILRTESGHGKSEESQPTGMGMDGADMVAETSSLSPHIGQSLSLMRLVLVSPDIPAEALFTKRTNYLGPSIRRFSECILFSNAGDAVLAAVSRLANYFGMPYRSRTYSWRLGNVRVVNTSLPGKGAEANPDQFREAMVIGRKSVLQIEQEYDRHTSWTVGTQFPTATAFSVFDCTDAVENGKRFMSFWSPRRGGPSWVGQLMNLIGKNCHAGYFVHPVTNDLLMEAVVNGSRSAAATTQADSGIRVLLSMLRPAWMRYEPSASIARKPDAGEASLR